jgi:hypothetical protein
MSGTCCCRYAHGSSEESALARTHVVGCFACRKGADAIEEHQGLLKLTSLITRGQLQGILG